MDFNFIDGALLGVFFYLYYFYNFLSNINQQLKKNSEQQYEQMQVLIQEIKYMKNRLDSLTEMKYQETDEYKEKTKVFKELERDALYYKS